MFRPTLTEAISDANNSMITPVDILTTKIFVALEFSGGIGMLFLVFSVFLSQVQAIRQLNNSRSASDGDGAINRTWTWTSFCVSWIISCFSFCLLFFAGRQFDVNEEPAYGLCLIQATLIYSSPPLWVFHFRGKPTVQKKYSRTACTTFAVFFDLWRRFRASEMGPTPPATKGTVMVSVSSTESWYHGRLDTYGRFSQLLAAPYVLWIFLTIGILIVSKFPLFVFVFESLPNPQAGRENPQTVKRDLASAPYCIMSDSAMYAFHIMHCFFKWQNLL